MAIIDEDITEKAMELRESVGGYIEQVFKNYGGEEAKER